MAQLFPGHTKCAFCGEKIARDEECVGFAAFLPPTHHLWKYSDGVFHTGCYESWPQHEEFQRLYDKFRDVWQHRPVMPSGMSFSEFEKTPAMIEFQNRLGNLFSRDEEA